MVVYRNASVRPQLSPWVPFYEPSGIAISKVSTQSQHFVGFVIVDDQMYAHTGGHSVVVFERFIDVAFPIEVARRIAEPEVKREPREHGWGQMLVVRDGRHPLVLFVMIACLASGLAGLFLGPNPSASIIAVLTAVRGLRSARWARRR